MTSPLAMTLRAYAQSAPSLMRPHLAAAADAVEECARLRHDIERHVAIAADLATEAERLRAERDEARDCISFNAYRALEAERDAARADALALAAERNNWQSMYQDAMAERDEALALLRKLAIIGVTANLGVLHHYRCAACGGRWSGRPADAEQHKDGCLAALRGDEK